MQCQATAWKIEPQTRGSGIDFKQSLVGQNVDRNFVPSVEKGIKIMLALQELERHWGRIKSHPLLPNGMATINTGEIKAGPSPAFSPDYCNIHCSLKIYPYEKVDDVVKEFRDYISLVSQTDPWLKIHPPEVLDPDLIWSRRSTSTLAGPCSAVRRS